VDAEGSVIGDGVERGREHDVAARVEQTAVVKDLLARLQSKHGQVSVKTKVS
jgi:hypothetical protein